MSLPLTVSCFSKIQIGFTFLVPAHLGSPGKGPLNGCVCVCVCYTGLTDAVFRLHDGQSAHGFVDHRVVVVSLADALADAARDRARRPVAPRRHRALAAYRPTTHRRVNEVNARRARLVPGRVTVFGRVYHLGM